MLEIEKVVVVVVLIFLKHTGLCGWAVNISQLLQVVSTSGQELTFFTIHGPRRK